VLEQPGKDVRVELVPAPDPVGRVDHELGVAGADPDRVGGQGRVKLGVDDVDPRPAEREPVADHETVHGLDGALVREAELAAHVGSTQPGSWEPPPSSRIPRIEKWTSSPFGAARV
jgi:hypothetical protein